MKRLSIFVLIAMCVFICASTGSAWTDDVEGMLMTSTGGGDDPMTDPQSVLENIEGPADTSSEDATPAIEWE